MHFKYTNKPELSPELQIITAYSSVISHQVVEDGEVYNITRIVKISDPTHSYSVLTKYRVVGNYDWAGGNFLRETWDYG